MSTQHFSLVTAGVLAFAVAVALADLRTHRIPNLLTVPAALLGVIANVAATGASGAITSIGGLLLGLAAFLPFYLARGFGAGDVKAMGAIGAFVGLHGTIVAVACVLITGALGGLLVLTWIGGLAAVRDLARRLGIWAGSWATGQAMPLGPAISPAAGHRFPYGVAIACGTIASLAWS
jgi:prepilin peptidase CpaA